MVGNPYSFLRLKVGFTCKLHNHPISGINVEQLPSAVLYAGEGACSTLDRNLEISGLFARASLEKLKTGVDFGRL
jgi:hypothetical protein